MARDTNPDGSRHRRSLGRRLGVAPASAVLLVTAMLAGCDAVELDAATSILTVAPDGTTSVPIRCTPTDQPCSGSVLVRVGGMDGPAVGYSIPAQGAAAVVVTLTGPQLALVPAAGAVDAGIHIDEATPRDRDPRTVPAGLKRAGALTTRASVASDGTQTDAQSSYLSTQSHFPAISGDGRYVAFSSVANDLVPDDTNGQWDVFVRDRLTQTTTRVSVSSTGIQGNGESSRTLGPAISADGRYVAFTSLASNLVPDDTGWSGVYVHDRALRLTSKVSVSWLGGQANQASGSPSISGDGRYVAFTSAASNLVPGDTNGAGDVFVHDRTTGTTTKASVASDGTQSTMEAHRPTISADGRWITYDSSAPNLVAGDTNGTYDVFVHDRVTGATTRASVATSGAQGNGVSQQASISADGRYVAFQSYAHLVEGDSDSRWDVYVHDRITGVTTRASVSSAGQPANHHVTTAAISGDGRHVAFASAATNLAVGDLGGTYDVFLRDLTAGVTTLVSATSGGAAANSSSGQSLAIDHDGRSIAFTSLASNLAPGDVNGFTDVFVRDLDD